MGKTEVRSWCSNQNASSDARRSQISEIKHGLAWLPREAENERIAVTRNGKPAGLLISLGSDEAWLDAAREWAAANRY